MHLTRCKTDGYAVLQTEAIFWISPMPTTATPKARTPVASFRLPSALTTRIDQLAEREGRTRTGMVVVLLEKAMALAERRQ